jgi:hypothetical protein
MQSRLCAGSGGGHEKVASFTLGPVEAAARTPMDSPIGRCVLDALRATRICASATS